MPKRLINNGSESDTREANQEFLARRSKRLRENKTVLDMLYSVGLTEKMLKTFHLGLSEQYLDKKKVSHENALVVPIINSSGKPSNKSVYFNIPKVTINPASEDF